MPARRRVTVLVIPETSKRTLSFNLRPAWLLSIPVLIICLATLTYVQYKENQTLIQQVALVDSLKRTNRAQEVQIDQIQSKVLSTQQQLETLQQLEQQIREITGQGVPAARSGSTVPASDPRSGRGGPEDRAMVDTTLPTLNAMLPSAVSRHLLGKHDTLQLHLAEPSYHQADPERAVHKMATAQQQTSAQREEMNRLTASLTAGKQAVEDQLDYLAHRPTGLPVSGGLLTDRFGARWSPFGWGQQHHEGIDLALGYGKPAVATGAGTVVHAGWLAGGYGYTVIIDHGYDFQTMYAHFGAVDVEEGDVVSRGDVIGWVGSTGNSTGPHVHYEVHLSGAPVDPMKYAQ